ncbi:MAG: hypothetical protein HQL27_04590, partial [Candidatus Omnitrophica bacterium]|nr:hypothetical protein [Candidatus Omnitrophota bacterium]
MKLKKGIIKFTLYAAIGITAVSLVYHTVLHYAFENRILKQVIERLEADTRVAEVLVTGVNYDEKSKKTFTTIKFLEYDTKGNSLEPRYFTFSGNIVQFQSLVIRFSDIHIRQASKFKDKSAYLFWKVFMLDGKNTQEYEVTRLNEIPQGYKLSSEPIEFENKLWGKFWDYAFDSKQRDRAGIKNVQIEAPGTMFIPGVIYTIKIENDGGLR